MTGKKITSEAAQRIKEARNPIDRSIAASALSDRKSARKKPVRKKSARKKAIRRSSGRR